MPFQRLFTVVCTHQYFASQPCTGVQLLPTTACQRLMQRYGLLLRQEGVGSISILHQQSTSGKIFMPACRDSLNFSLLASDFSFFNYTKTAQHMEDMLLFGNSKNTDAAVLDVSETEKWKDRSGNGYLFGGVSIIPPSQFRRYTAQLTAPAMLWQYYIVAQRSKEQYLVDGSAVALSFQPVTDEKKLESDSTYQSLLQTFPDMPVFWYQSEKPLQARQQAYSKIQLINTSTQAILFDNLPNPTPVDRGVKIIHL